MIRACVLTQFFPFTSIEFSLFYRAHVQTDEHAKYITVTRYNGKFPITNGHTVSI
jgi:hypothetical protein